MISRLSAWIRLFVWGMCPACNCDAPACDTCPVCQGAREGYPLPWHERLWHWHRFIAANGGGYSFTGIIEIGFLFEPRDCWIGVFWDTDGSHRLSVYVALLPMLPLRVRVYRRYVSPLSCGVDVIPRHVNCRCVLPSYDVRQPGDVPAFPPACASEVGEPPALADKR